MNSLIALHPSSSRHSSASRTSTQSFAASLRLSFLAAEKSSIHLKSIIFALNFFAVSFVLSVLPVSTIIISSAMGLAELRHFSKFLSSFFAIMQSEIVCFGIFQAAHQCELKKFSNISCHIDSNQNYILP